MISSLDISGLPPGGGTALWRAAPWAQESESRALRPTGTDGTEAGDLHGYLLLGQRMGTPDALVASIKMVGRIPVARQQLILANFASSCRINKFIRSRAEFRF